MKYDKMNIYGKLISCVNFLILSVLLVLSFTAYIIKTTWGVIDLSQILFFTHVNCGGG